MRGPAYRIVFMGTPQFAVPSLKVISGKEEVTLVITNPDRPKGRGRKVEPPPVKEAATSLGLEVYQPDRIKNNPDAVERIRGERPDLIVVIAYGKILPPEILQIPPLGCINIHASILPRYRGAAPLNWAIIRGEKKTGITIMKMDEGMDTGPMLLVKEEEIGHSDTAQSLSERLSLLGADAIAEALGLLKVGKLEEVPQNDEEATYAPMLKKEMGQIGWERSAGEIRNLVRGLHPWPGAFSTFGGKSLKVVSCRVEDYPVEESSAPGEIVEVRKDGVLVKCGAGYLLVDRVKPEGKKEIDAWAFVQGYRVAEGQCLGT